MKAPSVDVRPSNFWLCLIATLLAAGIAVVLLEPFQAAKGNTAAVTYTRGVLHVTIPHHAVSLGRRKAHSGSLDRKTKFWDARNASGHRRGHGRWREDIRLDKQLGVDDLVWHRVRYRYVYDDQKAAALEGTESISQILRTPVVHILGSKRI